MSQTASSNPAPERLLANRQYLAYFLAGGLSSVARWLEMLAAGIFIYAETASAFLVAMMTILRMLPLSLLGPPMGAIAERFNRRWLFLLGLSAMVLLMFILFVVQRFEMLNAVTLGIGMFVAGIFWVLDFPVRRVLVGESVPVEQIGRAMSIDTIINNGSRAVGPLSAGLLLQYIGIGGAFVVSALLYAISVVLLLWLTETGQKPTTQASPVWASMRDGFSFIRSERTLSGILLVTVIYNLFCFPATAMVPVIGRDFLNLEAGATGLLASMEGVGICFGGLAIALWATLKTYRRVYVFGLALCIGCWLLFSISPTFSLASMSLLIAGLGAAGFSSMQPALLLYNTPVHYRSRIFGVLSVCIGTAPLGFLQMGLMADRFGAQTAIVVSAVGGIAAIGALRWFWPGMFHPQGLPSSSSA